MSDRKKTLKRKRRTRRVRTSRNTMHGGYIWKASNIKSKTKSSPSSKKSIKSSRSIMSSILPPAIN